MVLGAGAVVAGYRVEKVLGSGGMGTVYLAANPVLPRMDALKVLSAELSQDPAFRARFIREADLAATLDHPNVVTVYTRGETEEGQLWIAMQYVAGSDAHKELEEGRMPARRAVHIIGEVAKALDYAHRRNVIHRDIKPANFLLAPDDERERVFLADFGIARALDDSVGLTQTGMVMATVAYAAPETLSDGQVDGRADIYALGCSLYRLLTGRAPFASSGGMAAMMAAHLSMPPPRVSDHAAVPEAMNAVIAKAMAKDPDQRYQTARVLSAAASAALEEMPTTPVRMTLPGGPSHRVPPPVHQNVSAPGRDALTYPSGYFSGARAAQQPAGPMPRGPQDFRPPPHEPNTVRPAPPRPRRRRWIVAASTAVVVAVAATVGVVLWNRGEARHGYEPQAFSHAHGTTPINAEPHAVAAVGPGDGDAVLALGVQPVVMTAPNGHLASWEQQLVTGNPKVLSTVDVGAVGAAKPDVVIATGDIDDATYKALAGIAPTITRPADKAGSGWTWQNQMSWIGQILGRDDKVKELADTARTQQNDLRDQHPAFNGKSVAVVNVSDNGVTGTLVQSYTSDYLEGLGMRYIDQLKRTAADTGDARPVIADMDFYRIEQANVLVVVRTDKAAGNGGYNGLPPPLTTYQGAMVIVDDPNTIAALSTGGYAATEYLNSTFVDNLAQQVH